MSMRKFGDAGHRPQTADGEALSALAAAGPEVDPEDPQGLSRTALRHLGAAQNLPEVEAAIGKLEGETQTFRQEYEGNWIPEAP